MFVTFRVPSEDGRPFKVFDQKRPALGFAKQEVAAGADKVMVFAVDALGARAAVAAVQHEECELVDFFTAELTEREIAERQRRIARQELRDLLK